MAAPSTAGGSDNELRSHRHREIVAKFRLVKNDPSAILDLDRELAARSVAA
jgi:hypothetical protein